MIRIGFAILNGGRGQRMNGVDKGSLTCDGQSFLQRIASLSDGFSERLISGDPRSIAPPSGFRVIPDEWPNLGPMAGAYSLLLHCESDALLMMGCDMPLFNQAAVDALLAGFSSEDTACALALAPEQPEPLAAIYRRALLPEMRQAIQSGHRSLRRLLLASNARCIPFDDALALSNVNTPEEYAQLIKAARSRSCAQDSGALPDIRSHS